MPGEVITFYSYKGGTGRTMALANVGCLLAQREAGPVLLIDWDLEAPGLHEYFRSLIASSNEGLADHAGLMDLLVQIASRVRAERSQTLDAATALVDEIDLAQFVIETSLPGLHLMKAGRFDSKYASRVNSFAWTRLHNASPSLMPVFAERLASEYAYVLIDSRTGLTDSSGVCTMLLPEKLVVVFTPGRQSLTGIADLVRGATRYRRESGDLRPLVVYPLPSRIDIAEPELQRVWRFGDASLEVEGYQPLFERILADSYDLPTCSLEPYFDDVQLQHISRLAYGEDLSVLVESSNQRLSLTRSYTSFADRMTSEHLPWETEASTIGEQRLFVNRRKEQDLFIGLLANGRRERLMAIQAGPGTGKSALLQQLAYLCRREAIPASLVALGEPSVDEPTSFAVKVSQDLATSGLRLRDYERLTHAYATRDVETIDITSKRFSGWSSSDEAAAREQVLMAFEHDVLNVASRSQVVLLIDELDEVRPRLRRWLARAIRRWVLAPEATRLIVVTASRGIPIWDEDLPGYAWVHVKGLSAFTREDLVEFLTTSGAPADPESIDLLGSLVQRGVPVAQIIAVAASGH